MTNNKDSNFTWRSLNEALSSLSEFEVKVLLDAEIEGPKRVKVIERLHQRYNTLRVARERQELIPATSKKLLPQTQENVLDGNSHKNIYKQENWMDIISNERNFSGILEADLSKLNEKIPDSSGDCQVDITCNRLLDPVKTENNISNEVNIEINSIDDSQINSSINTLPDSIGVDNNIDNKTPADLNLIEDVLRNFNNTRKNFISNTNNELIQIGINDLEKYNEEAVFDALNFFEKKCPYCSKDQYRIGVRDKIEIDHFMPISKGGQNVPWNLIPICKECNRKKKATLPSQFLDMATFNLVNDYLISVKNKFSNIGIYQHSNFQIMENIILRNKDFIRKNISENFVIELINLLKIEDKKYISDDLDTNRELMSDLVRSSGIFSNGLISSPFQKICELISDEYGVSISQIELKKLAKRAGWIDAGRIASREFSVKKHVIYSPKLIHLSKSDLRRITET
jgi:hypothetical protein